MKKRILCVDDEIEAHKGYAAALRPEYIVVKAMGSEEALQILGRRRDIDAVLSDYCIDELTGVLLTRRIRGLGLDVPVLIVTNSNPEDKKRLAKEAGAYDVVHKVDSVYKPVLEKMLG